MNTTGNYTTNQGDLTIEQTGENIIGKYSKAGILEGSISGNVITGIWINSGKEGLFEFVFEDDLSFKGKYKIGTEQGTMRSKWDGQITNLNNTEASKDITTGEKNEPKTISEKKNGIAKWVDEEGNVFDGTWENDILIKGIITYHDGSVEEGEFNEEGLNGKGKCSYRDDDGELVVEEGKFLDGLLIKGAITWESGSKEEGEFNEEGLNGLGIAKWPDDSYQQGEWINGEFKEGFAKMNFEDGSNYEGEMKGEDFNGYGKSVYKDDDGEIITEEGNWENDVFISGTSSASSGFFMKGSFNEEGLNGLGIKKFPDGSFMDGEWKDGEFVEGTVKLIFEDGGSYAGEYKNDDYHGNGTLIYSDGSNMIGNWDSGQLFDGMAHIKYDDGSAYIGQYANFNFNGNGKFIDINGDVKEGFWIDGVLQIDDSFNSSNKIIGIQVDTTLHKIELEDGMIYYGETQNEKPFGKGFIVFSYNEIIECEEFEDTDFEELKFVGIDNLYKEFKYQFSDKNVVKAFFTASMASEGEIFFNDGLIYKGSFDTISWPPVMKGYGEIYDEENNILFKGDFNEGVLNNELGEEIFNRKISEAPKYVEHSFSDGLTYKGWLANSSPNGQGKKQYANGNCYDGIWKDNVLIDGIARILYENGQIFEGEYKNGNYNGKGKYTFSNGQIFEGNFKDGEYLFGKYTWPNGWTYEGEYLNGVFNGKGKLTSPENVIYEGEFYHGQKNGFGRQDYPNKDFKNGIWELDNLMEGKVRLTNSNKYRYEGDLKNGERDGNGKLYDPNNDLIEDGLFKNGDFVSGFRKITLEDGTKITGDTENGQGRIEYLNKDFKDGLWKEYIFIEGVVRLTNSHGYIYEGSYLKGNRHGNGKLYNPEGVIDYEGEYKDGEKLVDLKKKAKQLEDVAIKNGFRTKPSALGGLFSNKAVNYDDPTYFKNTISEKISSGKVNDALQIFIYYYLRHLPSLNDNIDEFVKLLESLKANAEYKEIFFIIAKILDDGSVAKVREMNYENIFELGVELLKKFRVIKSSNGKDYFGSNVVLDLDFPINGDYEEYLGTNKRLLQLYLAAGIKNEEKNSKIKYLISLIEGTEDQWKRWAEYRRNSRLNSEKKSPSNSKDQTDKIVKSNPKKVDKKDEKTVSSKKYYFTVYYKIKLKEVPGFFNIQRPIDVFNSSKGDYRERFIQVWHNESTLTENKAKSYVVGVDKDIKKGIAGSTTIVISKITNY